MSNTTIQTSANPELLRQALEMILKPYSPTNSWSISMAGNQAIISNETETQLNEVQLSSIATFIEVTPDFNQAFYLWEGGAFIDNIPALRADALVKIDDEAGRTRSRYVTSIPGQDATYIAKEVDCRAYRAAGYPEDTTGFEWVQAEADATKLTPTEATDNTILLADQWKILGSAIEKVRRSGKIEVEKKIKASTIKASLEATILMLKST